MDHSADRSGGSATTLRERLLMSVVLDDAMVGALDQAAARFDAQGDGEGARLLGEATRRHRVGLIKHRARMAARGLDV